MNHTSEMMKMFGKMTNPGENLDDVLQFAEKMQGINGKEKKREIQKIGPEGNKGETVFDEEQKIIDENKEIAGFVVRSGDIVDGIGVLYADGTKGDLYGNSRGGGEHKIKFEPGDELVSVTGVKDVSYNNGKALSGIKFHTKHGRTYGPFGQRCGGGTEFSLSVLQGKRVKGLCGAAKKGNGGFIAAIGLLVE